MEMTVGLSGDGGDALPEWRDGHGQAARSSGVSTRTPAKREKSAS